MQTPTEILEAVENGHKDPLEAFVLLKHIITSAEFALDVIKPQSVEAFKHYGEKSITVNGATISYYSGRATYKYDHIPEIAALSSDLKGKQEEAKRIYKLINDRKMQVDPTTLLGIDPNTGELKYPAHVEYSAESLIVKLDP